MSITAETCPHYIAADDSMITDFNTNAKINPPLRTHEDVKAVIEGLKDGTIDAIATDHAPHSYDEKNREFSAAPFGSVGLETAFSVCYTALVKKARLPLARLLELMSKNPALILGVEGGEIKEGAPADLTVLDINREYIIDSAKFASKSKNSVFEGRAVTGSVAATFVGGEIKYNGGLIKAK